MEKIQLLMTPGPTVVPEPILKALARPVIHHRTKEFSDMFEKCTENLKKVYKTQNDLFTIAGSGTAAMEAAVCNTIEKGDKVLSIVSGKFSERFAELAMQFGADVEVLDFPWGSEIDVDIVKERLTDDTKLVTLVYNETSTGVRNPAKEIAELTKNTDTLVVVDAISNLGGDKFETDEWGIDMCVAGSQKCFAMTTGLSFISVSEKAWGVINKNKTPTYYLDLKKYKKKYPQTPFSSAVSLVFGLDVALDLILEEGIDERVQRHADNAQFCRDTVKEMGLELFPEKEEICSNTLTSVKYEKSADLIKLLDEKYNIRIAGGQADVKGKIFRIGHMGCVGKPEIEKTTNAIKEILEELK